MLLVIIDIKSFSPSFDFLTSGHETKAKPKNCQQTTKNGIFNASYSLGLSCLAKKGKLT